MILFHCFYFTSVACTDGQLRLAGGTASVEGRADGRVEICIGETWGTICDDMWSDIDAQVACRSLGYSYMGKHQGSLSYLYVQYLHIHWPKG